MGIKRPACQPGFFEIDWRQVLPLLLPPFPQKTTCFLQVVFEATLK